MLPMRGGFLILCRSFSQIVAKPVEADVFHMPVMVKTRAGEEVPVDAVYQDTMPAGSDVGTVLNIHGCPGSHNCFKYITPLLTSAGIRTIGVNFPGMRKTSYDERLRNDNFERQSFVKAHLDYLKPDKIVIVGHSRGGENAVMTAAENREITRGLILANAPGFTIHRGIRPRMKIFDIKHLVTLWRPLWSRPLTDALMWKLYQFLGFKVKSGFEAGVCVATMSQCSIDGQRPFVERISESDMAVLMLFSGQDWIIEDTIPKHMAKHFRNMTQLVSAGVKDDPEENAFLMKEFAKTKRLSVCFDNDGHFCQKTRAKLIAQAAQEMLLQ